MIPTSFGGRPLLLARTPGPAALNPEPSSSTMGIPLTLYSHMILRDCPIVAPGGSVIGSTITPFSLRLTFSTSRAWFSTERLLWMIPIPPSCASAIASADSVTVPIGALTRGRFGAARTLRVAGGVRGYALAAGAHQQDVGARGVVVQDLGVFHVKVVRKDPAAVEEM